MGLPPNSMNEAVEGELRVSMFSQPKSLHFLTIVLLPHLPRLLSSSPSAQHRLEPFQRPAPSCALGYLHW
ncbi:hypothetical protein Y032_0111g259 [Ancylostoma ceylanicum]|uniref:Uncharacterized protein n=1 Tax=Ancylostoma ceylanicum TaxID=53326 RepID=A0A016TEE5_9BILA|nr:hypothetical protein Y032_0111g259 [Ancylostoma ceylanicum]